jgi:hypothetical protein
MSEESKTSAALRLSNLKHKLRRIRHKRELVDLPILEDSNLENLLTSVRGTEGWAKIERGSVKIVKRTHPA